MLPHPGFLESKGVYMTQQPQIAFEGFSWFFSRMVEWL
jgi:hypothetical protein